MTEELGTAVGFWGGGVPAAVPPFNSRLPAPGSRLVARGRVPTAERSVFIRFIRRIRIPS